MNEIFKHLAVTGDTFVLYLLAASSVLSFAVMFDRWRTYRRYSADTSALLDGLSARLEKRDVAGAVALLEKSQQVEARVALAGLQNFSKGQAAVEEIMISRWLREKLELEKYLIILGTLGNNAPFVGLFGTVLGIIKAFNDLALTGQSGVSVVMAGISSALIATAFGILVAIPAVVANNYFVTRLKRIQTNTDSVSHILLAYLKEVRK
ncbi:MAG: MotA/TolQ/ExbB proton channel family protein [candidate division FCPU426 bacterium]